jgi:hypothetical protein
VVLEPGVVHVGGVELCEWCFGLKFVHAYSDQACKRQAHS